MSSALIFELTTRITSPVHILENNTLRIQVQDKGAELSSIFSKRHQLEYLWQADPAYWPRHAPVLFPVVGKLKEDSYVYQGKKYSLGQHGFARDKMFQCSQQSENSLVFELNENPESLEHYPFPFRLRIAYRLQESALAVGYEVENPGSQTMLFSIGAHPGFRCPLTNEESFDDYYLEFNQEETAACQYLENGLFAGGEETVLHKERVLLLSHDLFSRDALVFDSLKSDTVSLLSRKSSHGLRFHFPGFPYLGIWSKGQAPFVCIEPWHGLADHSNTNQQLDNKEGIRSLAPGAKFQCHYSIDFF